MNTIQINETIYFSKMTSLATAINALELNAAALPARSSVSAVMDRYGELCKALKEAIVSYESLLARDQKTMQEAGYALVRTDSQLTQLYK